MADLPFLITAVDGGPIAGARIAVAGTAGPMDAARSDVRGRAVIRVSDPGPLVVRVEGDGMESQVRELVSSEAPMPVVFVLGRRGLPYFHRGVVRVPFEPVTDALGVSLGPAGAPWPRGPEAVRTRAHDVGAKLGTRPLRDGPSFEAGRVTVLAMREDDLPAVLGLDAVEQAGVLVRLDDDHASFMTGATIVCLAPGVGDDAVADLAEAYGFTVDGPVGGLDRVHRLRLPGGGTSAALHASNLLAQDAAVAWAEPDLVHTVVEDSIVPGNFLFPAQWDHPIVGTPAAWRRLGAMDPARTFGSADVTIAIVDGGVDIAHPALSGVVSDGRTKVAAAFDFATMSSPGALNSSHGTGCASAATAAASTSPLAGGAAGVAGNCRLIAVRRGGPESLYAESYLWAAGFPVTSTVAGFPEPLSTGADVISSSFGIGGGSPISGVMSATFDRLTNDGRGGRGTLLFFSAGNGGVDLEATFERPWSMYERCLGIAASTLKEDGATEVRATYSNFGTSIDLCAPSDVAPGVLGAFVATATERPDDPAAPGSPEHQTTVGAEATPGASVLCVASSVGVTVGQACLIEQPGRPHCEGRRVTGVDHASGTVSIAPSLRHAHPEGTAVAFGAHTFTGGFGATSYSTPVCAATAALVLSADPRLSWSEVREILRSTATKIDADNANPAGCWTDARGRTSTDPAYSGAHFSRYFGYGRIDAARAVDRAVRGTSETVPVDMRLQASPTRRR